MSMNDLLSDLFARIRNAQRSGAAVVRAPYSKLLESVLSVLQDEGYIQAYSVEDVRENLKDFVIELKYFEGQPVIREIKRISKPGRRVYKAIADLPRYNNGLGIAILSTSKGVMSDFSARQANVGGEVLCSVF